jgi:hypothetical protein
MSVRRRRLTPFVALILLLGLGAGAQAASPSGSDAGAEVAFRDPVVAIPALTSIIGCPLACGYHAEPQLIVSKRGTVLVASHQQRNDCQTGERIPVGSHACVWRSEDDGESFTLSGGGQNTGTDVHFVQMPSGALLYTTLGNPDPGTFTSGIFGATVLRSEDEGKTWTSSFLQGMNPTIDRPFLTVLGDRSLLLTYTAYPGHLWASRSTDDGKTFGAAIPISAVPAQVQFTRPGGPALDKARGEVIYPYYAATEGDLAANNSSMSGYLDLRLARSADGGLTWTDELVAARVRPILGVHAAVADDAGGEYLTWSARDDRGRPSAFFSRNLAAGSAWTAPERLGPADSDAFLSWPVARGDGGVAIAYVGTDFPNGVKTEWSIRVAISQDAGDTWRIKDVSNHTIYTGSQGSSYSTVADMFGIVLDGDGFLHLAWPRQIIKDGAKNNEIEYTRQVAGPPLGVRRAPTQLALSAPPSGASTDSTRVSATLSADGAPVAGQPVTLAVGPLAVTATTDSSGVATADLRLDLDPGVYTTTAAYAGSSEFTPSSATAQTSVEPDETTLVYTGQTAGKGEQVAVSASLTEDEGVPLRGQAVTFSSGNSTVTATTNSAGIAEASLSMPDHGRSATIAAEFAGAARHGASSTTAVVTWGGRGR